MLCKFDLSLKIAEKEAAVRTLFQLLKSFSDNPFSTRKRNKEQSAMKTAAE